MAAGKKTYERERDGKDERNDSDDRGDGDQGREDTCIGDLQTEAPEPRSW
jgi:hypothetical protein